MKIITDLNYEFKEGRTACAIGKFDGIHMGHRKLLAELIDQKKNGLIPCVMTFDPSPEVFFGFGPKQELSTREEKRKIFERLGIELLMEFPFNKETAATPPDAFVRNIFGKELNAAFIAAGNDLSFGDRGAGNFELLRKMEKECGYKAKMIDKVEVLGEVVSSTRVRNLVAQGRMEEVTACLGEPYTVVGTVMHGRALGRTIDIPTVNQVPDERKLLPPFGVYYADVEVGGRHYKGMTNIGVKPTVTSEGRVTVETYLYDFTGDLYGETITTSLLTYRRPERKFSGIEELKRTMEQDLEAGREYADRCRDEK